MNKSDIDNIAKLVIESVNKKADFGKADLVKDSGPEAADGFEKKMEEYEGATVEDGKPSEMKKKTLKKENNSMLKNSFDSLFKNTIVEQDEMVDDTEVFGEEGAENVGGEEEAGEEVDVSTRLQMIINDLQGLVDELGGASEEEGEEEGEEEEAMEEGMEDEEAMEEAYDPELKPLSDAGGKKLMGKGSMKVGGKLKSSGGSAHSGNLKNAPEPSSMSDAGGRGLMGKGAMKVSSKIAAGKDLFNV